MLGLFAFLFAKDVTNVVVQFVLVCNSIEERYFASSVSTVNRLCNSPSPMRFPPRCADWLLHLPSFISFSR